MKNNLTLHHMRITTIDGMTVKFPVSKHALRVGEGGPSAPPPPEWRARSESSIAGAATAAPRDGGRRDAWRPSVLHQVVSLLSAVVLSTSSYGITYGGFNSTAAYFRDSDASRGNIFAAGLLGFSLNPGEITMSIAQGEIIALSPFFSPDPNTFPIMYRVRVEEQGGPSPLCALLEADGTAPPFTYRGSLLSLYTNATTTAGYWNLRVSLPDALGLVDGDICTVRLVYRGWNRDVPENTGYTDEEYDSFTFVFRGAPLSEEGAAPASAEHPLEERAVPEPDDDARGEENISTSTLETEHYVAPSNGSAGTPTDPTQPEESAQSSTSDESASPPAEKEETTLEPESPPQPDALPPEPEQTTPEYAEPSASVSE